MITELETCDCIYCNDGRDFHHTLSGRDIHWCDKHGEYVSDVQCPGCVSYERGSAK